MWWYVLHGYANDWNLYDGIGCDKSIYFLIEGESMPTRPYRLTRERVETAIEQFKRVKFINKVHPAIDCSVDHFNKMMRKGRNEAKRRHKGEESDRSLDAYFDLYMGIEAARATMFQEGMDNLSDRVEKYSDQKDYMKVVFPREMARYKRIAAKADDVIAIVLNVARSKLSENDYREFVLALREEFGDIM